MDLEKTIAEIDCLINFHEERENTFTMSVLQTCREYVEELKKMKDAEEQGLLIELKVPLGTRIWYLEEDFHDDTIEISCGIYDLKWLHFHKDEDFYLTREEAESALAEKGGAE